MYYTAVSQILISVFINMLIFDKLTQDKFRVIDGLAVGVRGALTRQKFDPNRFYDVVIAHVTIKLIGRIEKTCSSLCVPDGWWSALTGCVLAAAVINPRQQRATDILRTRFIDFQSFYCCYVRAKSLVVNDSRISTSAGDGVCEHTVCSSRCDAMSHTNTSTSSRYICKHQMNLPNLW